MSDSLRKAHVQGACIQCRRGLYAGGVCLFMTMNKHDWIHAVPAGQTYNPTINLPFWTVLYSNSLTYFMFKKETYYK